MKKGIETWHEDLTLKWRADPDDTDRVLADVYRGEKLIKKLAYMRVKTVANTAVERTEEAARAAKE